MDADPATILARLDAAEAPDIQLLRAICERIGYGRVMQATEQMWRERYPGGGEHTTGPCRATLDKAGFRSNLDLLYAWERVPVDAQRAARKAAGVKGPAAGRRE